MSLAAWESFLTECEDDLNANEAAVRSGSTALVPEWNPPTELGELPPELTDRARALVSRIGLLTTFVKYQMVALESDIEHAHRMETKGTHNKAIALFLDASV